jgi:type IX secretion system substrate protein
MSITIATAQQITPWVIAGAGAGGASGDYHLSWTLGEVVIPTYEQADVTLLQGFHQPNYLLDVLVREPGDDYVIAIYPNPTSRKITVEIEGTDKPLTAELFDIFGRLLFRKSIEPPKADLELNQLPGATYLLVILDGENKRVGLWRIQKVR